MKQAKSTSTADQMTKQISPVDLRPAAGQGTVDRAVSDYESAKENRCNQNDQKSDYVRMREEIAYKTRRIEELKSLIEKLQGQLGHSKQTSQQEISSLLENKNHKIRDLLIQSQDVKRPGKAEDKSFFNEWLKGIRSKERQIDAYKEEYHRMRRENEQRMQDLKKYNGQQLSPALLPTAYTSRQNPAQEQTRETRFGEHGMSSARNYSPAMYGSPNGFYEHPGNTYAFGRQVPQSP